MLTHAETNQIHDTGRADAIESGRGDMQSDVGMLFMGMIGSFMWFVGWCIRCNERTLERVNACAAFELAGQDDDRRVLCRTQAV